ncbi:hypothetical protein [Collimonas silvisoli]|uniref:hypothetical protein n=1 Tax=Collimonas silvisoli TaxID=2825884 RepID=UPI001B8CC082|nr:hypothetical protein [Collimonas silvisoli]
MIYCQRKRSIGVLLLLRLGTLFATDLSGAREVAIDLRLQADGRFSWAASYGATDKYAEGNWHVADDKVILTSDASVPFNWFKVLD